MGWAKVDDQLHGHPKWKRTSKGGRALWTTAMSWCRAYSPTGFVPADMLRILDGTRAEAASLVASGLWEVSGDGWQFHDWHKYQPTAEAEQAEAEAQSEGGAYGNHKRWHVDRNQPAPDTCRYCRETPPTEDVEPPLSDDEQADLPSGTRSGTRIGTESSLPHPTPIAIQLGGDRHQSDVREGASDGAQPCGREHDPERACRRCGEARKAAEKAEREAKEQRERDALDAARAARQSEADATPPDDGTGLERAKAAVRGALEGTQ